MGPWAEGSWWRAHQRTECGLLCSELRGHRAHQAAPQVVDR